VTERPELVGLHTADLGNAMNDFGDADTTLFR
jgi:hypothetical protein